MKKSGLLYMHGRDHRFRPILVLKAIKFNEMKLTADEVKEFMTYFSEYLLDNALLPGQIENWIMITDLTGIGLTNLPFNVNFFSQNFLTK